MSQAYSGVNANVDSGAIDVDISGWSADVSVNTFDSTTTADGGWDDETPATKRVEGSFDFFYNKSKKPTGATMNLTPGSTPTLTLYVNQPDGELLTGKGLIKKLSLKAKVKDGFVVTASFVNKGVWTLPS
jgi:hypothetical protein